MFIACSFTHRQDEIDLEDKEDHFQPQLGNVAFASAHDGWAFRIGQLAKQYADKLGCKASGLEQALWGDYAFQAKTKRIIRIKADQTHKHKPLFVQVHNSDKIIVIIIIIIVKLLIQVWLIVALQFALEPLWKLYEACSPGADVQATLSKAVKSLSLTQVTPFSVIAHIMLCSCVLDTHRAGSNVARVKHYQLLYLLVDCVTCHLLCCNTRGGFAQNAQVETLHAGTLVSYTC